MVHWLEPYIKRVQFSVYSRSVFVNEITYTMIVVEMLETVDMIMEFVIYLCKVS